MQTTIMVPVAVSQPRATKFNYLNNRMTRQLEFLQSAREAVQTIIALYPSAMQVINSRPSGLKPVRTKVIERQALSQLSANGSITPDVKIAADTLLLIWDTEELKVVCTTELTGFDALAVCQLDQLIATNEQLRALLI